MALLTNVTIFLVLACISHQMSLGGCQKGHGRRGQGDRGTLKERSGQKVGRQTKSVSALQSRGNFLSKDKSECTWTATGENVIILHATCKKGDSSFSCKYSATPSVCTQYTANRALYWEQISKALKKHKNLCQDNGAIRARMCRRAARAHFRLRDAQKGKNATPSSPPFGTKAVKSCQPENKKLAEEFCSDSWSSFCTFLFTMVKDYDC